MEFQADTDSQLPQDEFSWEENVLEAETSKNLLEQRAFTDAQRIQPNVDSPHASNVVNNGENHLEEGSSSGASVGVVVGQRPKVKSKVLVVWDKDRKKWISLGKRPLDDDCTFFKNGFPTSNEVNLKLKEQGSKKSRSSDLGALSGPSKSTKKVRRVQSLKHSEFKKFLQCFTQEQDLKNFKVDTLFNKGESEATSSSNIRRKRTRTGQQQRSGSANKQSKMAATQVEYLAPLSSSSSFTTTNNDVIHNDLELQTCHEEHPFDLQLMSIDPSNPEHAFTVDIGGVDDDVANFEQVDLIDAFQVTSTPPRKNEYGITEITFDEFGKPRCTYTDLIERALTQNPAGLTVSEIYQWISDNYPFFKADDDRWKNSVRHNLSINPYFKKGEKARSGAGHLWTISEESRALRPSSRKNDDDNQELSMSIENDTDRAVADILGQYLRAKNSMEGKSKPINDEDSLCTPPTSSINQPSEGQSHDEHAALMETETAEPVVIEYESNGFPPGSEYTIDLSNFQFPDSTMLSFDDLMPNGSLIVIQADDQDANKENVQVQQEEVVNEYLMSYSVMRQESQTTETERVSGQLISEALTHDFDMHKDNRQDSSEDCQQQLCNENYEEQHEQHFQSLDPVTDQQNSHYLTLDSIDHLALQDVIQGNGEVGLYEMGSSQSSQGYEQNCNYTGDIKVNSCEQ